jgi:hypothetical protein
MRRLLGAVLLSLLAVGQAQAGQLDASWTAPTTNSDGSPYTNAASYHLYWFLYPNTPCPGTQFIVVPSPSSTPPANQTVSANLPGLTQGLTYNVQVTAVNATGNESGCSLVANAVARPDAVVAKPGQPGNIALTWTPNVSPPGPVTFGETTVGTGTKGNLGGAIIAFPATLATAGTLTKLTINIATLGTRVTLGVYTNANGYPGTLLASTGLVNTVLGWNTYTVQTPIALAPGTYWLASSYESNSGGPALITTGTPAIIGLSFTTPPVFPPQDPGSIGRPSMYGTVQ